MDFISHSISNFPTLNGFLATFGLFAVAVSCAGAKTQAYQVVENYDRPEGRRGKKTSDYHDQLIKQQPIIRLINDRSRPERKEWLPSETFVQEETKNTIFLFRHCQTRLYVHATAFSVSCSWILAWSGRKDSRKRTAAAASSSIPMVVRWKQIRHMVSRPTLLLLASWSLEIFIRCTWFKTYATSTVDFHKKNRNH